MKVKILYTDWLMLTRGELRPEIGDKYTNKLNNEVSTINDEKDLNIVQRLIKIGAFAYVVELEFPEIKWEASKNGYDGIVNKIPIFSLEDWGAYYVLFVKGDLFSSVQGTLEGCKSHANKLLYGQE